MKKEATVLLAEDEEALGTIIAESLTIRDFTVRFVLNGKDALHLLQSEPFDIAVLDVMMPYLDGFSLAKKIRMEGIKLPILFLTGKTMTDHVVEGFESGGNDYLKKPFAMEELIIRIRALLRANIRDTPTTPVALIGQYSMNIHKQQLIFQDQVIELTGRETQVLHLLFTYNQSVLEKKTILNTIWGNDNFFAARSLDVFITKLRKYLRADPSVKIINVRGVGYKLVW